MRGWCGLSMHDRALIGTTIFIHDISFVLASTRDRTATSICHDNPGRSEQRASLWATRCADSTDAGFQCSFQRARTIFEHRQDREVPCDIRTRSACIGRVWCLCRVFSAFKSSASIEYSFRMYPRSLPKLVGPLHILIQ